MGRNNPAYRTVRNYENLQKGLFYGVGEFDIPVLSPVKDIGVDDWIGFNAFNGCKRPGQTGLHFFLDDYQFERVWRFPEKYVPILQRFGVVCTPDFSPYADFPKAIQVYNHYRKHWCGAYWQSNGIKVVPTITWSSPDTLEWCFDGEPVGGVVAMSAVGMFDTDEHKRWLLDGCERMIERLNPSLILWKGRVPEELKGAVDRGLIQKIPSHVDKWRLVDDVPKEGV